MADTIIIRCAWCGEEIGRITYVEGEQRIGCPNCGKTTWVKINYNGKVETGKWGT